MIISLVVTVLIGVEAALEHFVDFVTVENAPLLHMGILAVVMAVLPALRPP
jgi:hypothetical protein